MAGGESRHWIQDVTSPKKENEDISGGNDTVQREEKYRGALARQYINIDRIYLNPSTTPMKIRKDCSRTSEIFFLTAALSLLCKIPKHMLIGMTI